MVKAMRQLLRRYWKNGLSVYSEGKKSVSFLPRVWKFAGFGLKIPKSDQVIFCCIAFSDFIHTSTWLNPTLPQNHMSIMSVCTSSLRRWWVSLLLVLLIRIDHPTATVLTRTFHILPVWISVPVAELLDIWFLTGCVSYVHIKTGCTPVF